DRWASALCGWSSAEQRGGVDVVDQPIPHRRSGFGGVGVSGPAHLSWPGATQAKADTDPTPVQQPSPLSLTFAFARSRGWRQTRVRSPMCDARAFRCESLPWPQTDKVPCAESAAYDPALISTAVAVSINS